WGLLVVVLVLTLAMVHMSVLINEWNNTFYTALQNKDRTVFLQQLVGLSWLVTLIVFFSVYQLYLSQMLEIRWRRWLTHRYLRGWVAARASYRSPPALRPAVHALGWPTAPIIGCSSLRIKPITLTSALPKTFTC